MSKNSEMPIKVRAVIVVARSGKSKLIIPGTGCEYEGTVNDTIKMAIGTGMITKDENVILVDQHGQPIAGTANQFIYA